MKGIASLSFGQRSHRTTLVPAPALPRIALAVAAATGLHLLAVVGTRLNAGATAPSSGATVMTVRSILATESQSRSAVAVAVAAALPSGTESSARFGVGSEAAPAVAAAVRGERNAAEPVREGLAALPAAPAPDLATSASLPAKAPTAERPTGLPPAPGYLLGANLDPGPQPVGNVEPEYPESANLQEGTVVIRVLIGDTGQVDNVAVVRSEPKGLFEASALEAFGKAQFLPGRVAGVAVKSQITVEVHFLPINRGSRISGRGY